MQKKRGCRTSKYFLLGGSPALYPNGGEIGCDFAPIPYKHSSWAIGHKDSKVKSFLQNMSEKAEEILQKQLEKAKDTKEEKRSILDEKA